MSHLKKVYGRRRLKRLVKNTFKIPYLGLFEDEIHSTQHISNDKDKNSDKTFSFESDRLMLTTENVRQNQEPKEQQSFVDSSTRHVLQEPKEHQSILDGSTRQVVLQDDCGEVYSSTYDKNDIENSELNTVLPEKDEARNFYNTGSGSEDDNIVTDKNVNLPIFLSNWALSENVPDKAMNKLLRALTKLHSDLPQDIRSLRKRLKAQNIDDPQKAERKLNIYVRRFRISDLQSDCSEVDREKSRKRRIKALSDDECSPKKRTKTKGRRLPYALSSDDEINRNTNKKIVFPSFRAPLGNIENGNRSTQKQKGSTSAEEDVSRMVLVPTTPSMRDKPQCSGTKSVRKPECSESSDRINYCSGTTPPGWKNEYSGTTPSVVKKPECSCGCTLGEQYTILRNMIEGNTTTLKNMIEKVMISVEQIKQQGTGITDGDQDLEIYGQFPMNTREHFIDIGKQLEDHSFKEIVVKWLVSRTSTKMSSVIAECLKILMTDDLIMNSNWTGTNDKLCLQNTWLQKILFNVTIMKKFSMSLKDIKERVAMYTKKRYDTHFQRKKRLQRSWLQISSEIPLENLPPEEPQ